jgi:hypothetical protein
VATLPTMQLLDGALKGNQCRDLLKAVGYDFKLRTGRLLSASLERDRQMQCRGGSTPGHPPPGTSCEKLTTALCAGNLTPTRQHGSADAAWAPRAAAAAADV